MKHLNEYNISYYNKLNRIHKIDIIFSPTHSIISVPVYSKVFFILRKKQNQVTFLHVYHHTITSICSWLYVKFLPGQQGAVIIFLNSLVHVIMYTYYLISALGPKYKKYLWWKKYMTWIQLVKSSLNNYILFFKINIYIKHIFFTPGAIFYITRLWIDNSRFGLQSAKSFVVFCFDQLSDLHLFIQWLLSKSLCEAESLIFLKNYWFDVLSIKWSINRICNTSFNNKKEKSAYEIMRKKEKNRKKKNGIHSE